MHVLVDFDNVPKAGPLVNLAGLAERIARTLTPRLPNPDRLDVRLYHGWYDEHGPTKPCQDYRSQLESEFPITVRLSATVGLTCVIELAGGLIRQPTHHLLHTYRERAHAFKHVRYKNPAAGGCTEGAKCPLHSFRQRPLARATRGVGPQDVRSIAVRSSTDSSRS